MMANLIDYHIPEAIQIRVTKLAPEPDATPNEPLLIEIGEDVTSPKSCNFCVDPQLTSYSILQSLVVRAFNLQCDFTLYYLDRISKKQTLISKDSDLNQAFRTSSHPFLDISLSEIDYGNTLANIAGDWQLSKNINKYRNILSEWDVVTNSDIILAQTINKTNNFIFKQLEKIKEKAISTTNNSWYLAETIYQYIISDDKRLDPIDDVAFRAFQDSEGRILSQRELRIAVYRQGVEQSLRRVIWKHLLNVYPESYTGQERIDFIKLRCETYRQMRDLWQMNTKIDPEVIQLCNMVRKDVYRTDRHHPFYANRKSDADEDENPNVTSLFNILITYALNHQYRYCQGMSDLASPLLFVMKDEAHAYISFCALMNRLGENFSLDDGQAINRKFQHLTALLKHYDPEFYRYLYEQGAHELLFCYRWILLDLKREFPFEEALDMLEVLWASIPPSNSAYQNLFDDGYLYIPNRTKPSLSISQMQASTESKCKDKRETRSKPKCPPKCKTVTGKPKNQRIRSIKFLPNVLSSDSQVLESPTTSDSDECDFAESLDREWTKAPKHKGRIGPWDSPDLTGNRKKFVFDQPSLGTSKCDSISAPNGECFEATLLDLKNIEDIEEHDVDAFHNFRKVNRNGSTSKSQTDDVSSCSTFDSGIQRSNTLSSVVQVSDESVQSVNTNRIDTNDNEDDKASGEASKRRQRFHCLNGLRNAHCNGDDFSEDEEVHGFDDNSIDDPEYLNEDCQAFPFTDSPTSAVTVLHNNNQEPRRHSKPSMKLAMAKTLLSVGKSFSIDSLSNGNASFDGCKQEKLDAVPQSLPQPVNKPQISVDIESPVNEFEMNGDQQFPKLMAKSVSEEVLNNMEGLNENMQTLSVTNHDEMSGDNLSSSSTSSLVILSKKSADTTKLNVVDMNQPLLTPEELGPNDAFMLFLCLTIMLQNRDRIMDAGMDRNDIQMFFDNMIRKHSVHSALNDARHLFHTYLSQWHKEYLHK